MHIKIETIGCGEIIAPIGHITLHSFGDSYRLLVRDDIEWRGISKATYGILVSLMEL